MIEFFMLKLVLRENMRNISRFLLFAIMLCGTPAYAATPVATTAGSNLTAFNGNPGATNNAMWNAYMNPRSNGAAANAPTADFGNCNAIILRCAQPKCANGGCSTMDIARPIVEGCVKSNSSCTQYGTELVEYISAQLVSDANAAAQTAAANAQMAAAQAAAQQSAQQMQQMQQQMQQMQQQMQQQSADTAAQIQAALAQQQAATNQAIADAASANAAAINNATAQMQTTTNNAATTTTASAPAAAATTASGELTTAQKLQAQTGIDANLLAREQIAGQILTEIENAEENLLKAETAMRAAFDYAGCDSSGSNCTGPRRVSTFKDRAMEFFDPYNDVLENLYDALILAQSVGVDITDIYMMLNGTCNVWGQYLCAEGQVMHYTGANCVNGKSVAVESGGGTVFGGADCKPGQVVPMSDGGCQLIKMLTSEEEVQRNWLYPETGEDGVQVRVGCASEALENSVLFRNMKRQADIDIETLQRIIEQDAPASYGLGSSVLKTSRTPTNDGLPFCQLNDETYHDLQKIASLKELPDKVCVTEREMKKIATDGLQITQTSGESVTAIQELCKTAQQRGLEYKKCLCDHSISNWASWDEKSNECICYYPDTEFDYDVLDCLDPDEVTADTVEKMKPITGYSYIAPELDLDLDFSFQNFNAQQACTKAGGIWVNNRCDYLGASKWKLTTK